MSLILVGKQNITELLVKKYMVVESASEIE
jgi:hypothetical protein